MSQRFTSTMQPSNFATPFSASYRMSRLLEYDMPPLGAAVGVEARHLRPLTAVRGMKVWQFSNTLEFSNRWSMQLLFQGATGGGTLDFLRDKDTAGFSLAYVF